jgi:hypothetical protein
MVTAELRVPRRSTVSDAQPANKQQQKRILKKRIKALPVKEGPVFYIQSGLYSTALGAIFGPMKKLIPILVIVLSAGCNGNGGQDDAGQDGVDAADGIDAGDPGGGDQSSPHIGKVIFNEVLTDGTTNEDANQDGTIDAMEDEFVELVNVSGSAVDLTGWILAEKDWDIHLPRHTFAQGITLDPNMAAVIFGGGDPPDSTAFVFYYASNAQDPGIPYGLDLDDAGDRMVLLDADGLFVDEFVYGDQGGPTAASDESLTRDPDLTGDFTPHSQATNASGAIFSPGTRVDGTSF